MTTRTSTTTRASDDAPENTSRNTAKNAAGARRSRSARTITRTIIGASVAAVTAFAPMAGVVDAAPAALLRQEGGDTAAAPSIELGDRNQLAAWWQDRLNEWLHLSGSDLSPIVVDGWYGPVTQEATIAFQEATEAVEPDGVVDPEDRVALHEAIEELENGAPPIELGDRNELAAWWQDRLNEWLLMSGSEMYPIVVDGWYGPTTQDATIAFQESTDAVEADGVVDPEDRVALREAIEALQDGAAPVQLGDRNQLAAWWQDRLNEWLQLSGSDLYPMVVDGWYGPNTQEATIAFQEATEAVEPDGVVDPEDRVALREAIDSLIDVDDDGADGGTDDGAEGFGTAAVISDDFPAIGETNQLQDVSVVATTDQAGAEQVATDRLVFEFGADGGDLSYEVEYTDTVLDTAGTPVEVEGDATLAVRITPASGVDLSGDEATPTYAGPDRFSPDTASAVTELALAEDFEAAMTWAVGVDEKRPFRVQIMEDPARLVVDVRTG